MNQLGILLQKELRELLTPALFIPLILTVGIFYGIGQLSSVESKRVAETPTSVRLIDHDQSELSNSVRGALTQLNIQIDEVTPDTPIEEAVSAAQAQSAVAVIVIPPGFNSVLTNNEPYSLSIYQILRSFSATSTSTTSKITAATELVNQLVSDQLISARGNLDPQFAKHPIQVIEHVVVNERFAAVSSQQMYGYIQSQIFFIPLIVFIVITFASQMIATSIASEKENKTLESLLSAPVSRQAIVLAKLLAAGILALVFALVYMIGFSSYLNGLTGGGLSAGITDAATQAAATLGLTFTTTQYAILGVTLFLGIINALAMALILGAFAEDVKGIQAVVTPLMVLLLIPYLLISFFDIQTLSNPVKWLIYAIPFSHPFLAPQQLIFNQLTHVWAGIAYQVVIFACLVGVAARIFSTDAIMTLKLNFGKKRR